LSATILSMTRSAGKPIRRRLELGTPIDVDDVGSVEASDHDRAWGVDDDRVDVEDELMSAVLDHEVVRLDVLHERHGQRQRRVRWASHST
jgi:hypothetical protein